MPLELDPKEQVLFPSPFVATEHHPLVVTNQRVVQYAPQGAFPVAQFKLESVDFIGRVSERSHLPHAIVAGLLGLILFIAGAAKVLPPALHAGAKPGEAGEAGDGAPVIEGRNADDDYPFADDSQKAALIEKAKKLKALKESFKPGIPPLTDDVKSGLVFVFFGALFGGGGYLLFKRQRHVIFCRTSTPPAVHSLLMKDPNEQLVVLATLQGAHQAALQAKPK